MKVRRFSFKTLPPEWRNCEAWPEVDLSAYDKDTQDRFERLSRGLRLYLSTGRLKSSAIEAGCSGDVLIDMLNRCVHVQNDGEIVGWAGLIAKLRIKGYARTKPIDDSGSGTAGMFEQFLRENEDRREILHKLIRAGGGRGQSKSHAPTLRSIFKVFRSTCLDSGMTLADYPWSSKSGGRRSIERYAGRFIVSDGPSAKVWLGADAAAALSLGTGPKSFAFATAPMDVVGVDAHKIHCIGVVIISGPAGPQPVPVDRIWIYPVVDKKSRCVLGYSVSIRKEISASNVEEAFVNCDEPWKPRELVVKGVGYIAGAGRPVGLIPGFDACRPCIVRMDNAAQHFANRISMGVRRTFGCSLMWGGVGAWWRNAVTERFFRTLEMYGFQKLPSSTGSNPADPRRTDPVTNAIKHGITWEGLLDLVDVLIANYNATKHRGLGNRTPLEVLATHLHTTGSSFIPRLSVPVTMTTPKLGVSVETRTIAGCAKLGRIKRPYVEIDKVAYTSSTLSARFDLLKQPIIVHINERNMCEVTAFIEGGRPIGRLTPQAEGWRTTPHTREMRKAINALIDIGDIASDATDYVLAYLKTLATRAHKEIINRPGCKSPSATRLADAARASGSPIPDLTLADLPKQSPSIARPMPRHIKQPSWRSQ